MIRLVPLLTIAPLIYLTAPTNSHAQPKARNAVLIVADDLGRDLGCYGNSNVKTPNLDRLASQGTRFTHAFATTASCSASRSVILTGLHNHANGQFGHQHDVHNFHTYDRIRGLPVLLSAAGYRTARVGKLHVQPDAVYHFDRVLVPAEPGGAGGRNGVAMADSAREFLSEASDRPFFLYFCPTDPHRGPGGFANNQNYPGLTPIHYNADKITVPPFLPDAPETREELAGYLEAVSRLDQGVGRLLRVLDETGHADDTLVIFLSDNGMAFPGAKTNLYDAGIRLPLIVRAPGGKKGVVSNAMASWTDIVPTFLDFAGAKGPDYPLHGRSFLSILDKPDPPGWDEVFASHTFHEVTNYYPMRAIRTREYKLIYNVAHPLEFSFASDLYASKTWQGVLKRKDKTYGPRTVDAYIHRPQFELYDLKADPLESHNLAADEKSAATLRDLQDRLFKFQTRTKDPWAVKRRYE